MKKNVLLAILVVNKLKFYWSLSSLKKFTGPKYGSAFKVKILQSKIVNKNLCNFFLLMSFLQNEKLKTKVTSYQFGFKNNLCFYNDL